ncbi:MAG: hypothetical protein Q4B60_09050 [Erysipelotrichaceae bacterium]|nr:hypothetical protein [Erysipelotrichaceae bacterium]
MSRSFKHTPIYKYKDNSNAKRAANKAVRRYYKGEERLPKGNEYKKIYDSWFINDYISYCPEVNEPWWYQCYLRK